MSPPVFTLGSSNPSKAHSNSSHGGLPPPKFVNLSPNEELQWRETEAKKRREERWRQVREQEKQKAQLNREKYKQKKSKETTMETQEQKLLRLLEAKKELQSLRELHESVLSATTLSPTASRASKDHAAHASLDFSHSVHLNTEDPVLASSATPVQQPQPITTLTGESQSGSGPPASDGATQRQNITSSVAAGIALAAATDAVQPPDHPDFVSLSLANQSDALPNTAYGKGFLRSEELREAKQIQEFVDAYQKDQRQKDEKLRFQKAYEAEVMANKRKEEEAKQSVMDAKSRMDSVNAKRLLELKARQAKKRKEATQLGVKADTLVMCQDSSGYVDWSQTRFHVIRNTEELQEELDNAAQQHAIACDKLTASKESAASLLEKREQRGREALKRVKQERLEKAKQEQEVELQKMKRVSKKRQASLGSTSKSVERTSVGAGDSSSSSLPKKSHHSVGFGYNPPGRGGSRPALGGTGGAKVNGKVGSSAGVKSAGSRRAGPEADSTGQRLDPAAKRNTSSRPSPTSSSGAPSRVVSVGKMQNSSSRDLSIHNQSDIPPASEIDSSSLLQLPASSVGYSPEQQSKRENLYSFYADPADGGGAPQHELASFLQEEDEDLPVPVVDVKRRLLAPRISGTTVAASSSTASGVVKVLQSKAEQDIERNVVAEKDVAVVESSFLDLLDQSAQVAPALGTSVLSRGGGERGPHTSAQGEPVASSSSSAAAAAKEDAFDLKMKQTTQLLAENERVIQDVRDNLLRRSGGDASVLNTSGTKRHAIDKSIDAALDVGDIGSLAAPGPGTGRTKAATSSTSESAIRAVDAVLQQSKENIERALRSSAEVLALGTNAGGPSTASESTTKFIAEAFNNGAKPDYPPTGIVTKSALTALLTEPVCVEDWDIAPEEVMQDIKVKDRSWGGTSATPFSVPAGNYAGGVSAGLPNYREGVEKVIVCREPVDREFLASIHDAEVLGAEEEEDMDHEVDNPYAVTGRVTENFRRSNVRTGGNGMVATNLIPPDDVDDVPGVVATSSQPQQLQQHDVSSDFSFSRIGVDSNHHIDNSTLDRRKIKDLSALTAELDSLCADLSGI